MFIKIRVTPGSKKEEMIEKDSTHFNIWVREKPERNMANKRVVELVAGKLKIPVNKIRIISGHHSPRKILSVDI